MSILSAPVTKCCLDVGSGALKAAGSMGHHGRDAAGVSTTPSTPDVFVENTNLEDRRRHALHSFLSVSTEPLVSQKDLSALLSYHAT